MEDPCLIAARIHAVNVEEARSHVARLQIGSSTHFPVEQWAKRIERLQKANLQ